MSQFVTCQLGKTLTMLAVLHVYQFFEEACMQYFVKALQKSNRRMWSISFFKNWEILGKHPGPMLPKMSVRIGTNSYAVSCKKRGESLSGLVALFTFMLDNS